MRPPDHQHPNETSVYGEAQTHQGTAADVLHQRSEQQGTYSIHDAEAYHHVADRMNSHRARYIRLSNENENKLLISGSLK